MVCSCHVGMQLRFLEDDCSLTTLNTKINVCVVDYSTITLIHICILLQNTDIHTRYTFYCAKFSHIGCLNTTSQRSGARSQLFENSISNL